MKNSQLLKEIKSVKTLSKEVLFDGARLCYENANNLFELAKYAYEKRIYSHAVSLCVLAAEELGKMEMMLVMSLGWQIDPTDWYIFWKIFSGKGHDIKLRAFYTFQSSVGDNNLDKIIGLYWSSRNFGGTANFSKKSGFYIDFNKELGRFTKGLSTKDRANKWIIRVENSLKRSFYITELSFNSWKKISRITKGFIPDGIGDKIADEVYKFRQKNSRVRKVTF